jgi:hypothetical protein
VLIFFPPRPIAPLSSSLRIKFFTAEPPHELLGVLGVSEAIDIPPLAFVKDRVTISQSESLSQNA